MRIPVSVGRAVARVGVGPVAARPPGHPSHPYTRPPRTPPVRNVAAPVTQTPTVTGTGVTTTSGGNMPGAPPSPTTGYGYGGMPPSRPIKNWAKANPAQIAQAMLAPQYASLAAQHQQSQMMAGQQQSAITSYGLELAKILGTAGPAGSKSTLGPDYAAALSMSALRNFAYEQFVESSKYAGEYAKIASQYPTYLNQIMAQKASQKLKEDSFAFQKLIAAQQYGINTAKLGQENKRIDISASNANTSLARYKLDVAKAQRSAAQWNAGQADKAGKIDVRLSSASGHWVNSYGQPVKNVPFSNPPPPYRAPKTGSGKGGNGGGGPSGYQKTEIFDGAVKLVQHLNESRNIVKNPPGTGPVVQGREAYKRTRAYLHMRDKTLTPAQLNKATQAALVAGGYPQAPRTLKGFKK